MFKSFFIAYYLKCLYDDILSKLRIYMERDCQDWFGNELYQTTLELNYILNNPKPMTPIGSDERQSFTSHYKRSFPYEYLDCREKLTEECLPPQSSFFSKIHNETITNADYSHACHVWQSFQIKNLQEYAELYLKIDVLLLTDAFENFRNMCMKTCKLDALHYYTAPGLALNAMLKIINVNLELITDIEMATFIQRGIRSGISQCCNRYSEANNPYMGKHSINLT
nr:unnamed protein product [Callosobruchus analis]